MDEMIQSCNWQQFVEVTDVKRRVKCRNYFAYNIVITYYYDYKMQYLIGVHITNCFNPRCLRVYNEFITYMNGANARVIYLNTDYCANLELGDLVRQSRVGLKPRLVFKHMIMALVAFNGRYYLVRYKIDRKLWLIDLCYSYDELPRPIKLNEYSMICPFQECRNNTFTRKPCEIRPCFCGNLGFLYKCKECNLVSHLCCFGCGVLTEELRHHSRDHRSKEQRAINNGYLGEKPVPNYRDYIVVDTEALKRY
jgi:hypothetical protein